MLNPAWHTTSLFLENHAIPRFSAEKGLIGEHGRQACGLLLASLFSRTARATKPHNLDRCNPMDSCEATHSDVASTLRIEEDVR